VATFSECLVEVRFILASDNPFAFGFGVRWRSSWGYGVRLLIEDVFPIVHFPSSDAIPVVQTATDSEDLQARGSEIEVEP
jgi:hypothetical protein